MGWGTAVRYLLANWKMHTTVDQAMALVQAIQEGLRERAARGRQLPGVIVCPPFVSLMPLRAVVEERLVRLGGRTATGRRVPIPGRSHQ